MSSLLYLAVIALSAIIGGASQAYVRKKIAQYQNVPSTTGWSGYAAAKSMMARYGIGDLPVQRGGENEDHFDPRTNSITLDPHAYSQPSVTAVATACHEVGHACQYAQGYLPMKIRSSLVPAVNLGASTWMIVLLAGIFLNMVGLIYLAIALYGLAVLFHVVTLPVEFDASRRGLEYLKETGVISEEVAQAKSVLTACALTYVAAALVSAIQLVYLLAAYRR